MTALKPPAPSLDEPTRRAIREALRSGAAADPRIDALSRTRAQHDLRRRPRILMWCYAILSPLALVSAFVDDSHGAEHWVLVAAHLLVAVLFATSAWDQATTRRRAHRYLHPATEGTNS
jgi:hypothetical protein